MYKFSGASGFELMLIEYIELKASVLDTEPPQFVFNSNIEIKIEMFFILLELKFFVKDFVYRLSSYKIHTKSSIDMK